jgi:hypothetical protein
MEFSPDDFSRMMLPVHNADMSKSFISQFPELKLYEEFGKNLITPLETNRIIKYICFVYDKNSPYRIKFKDITQRKVNAILDCGYELEGERFHRDVEDVLQGKNPKVTDMIVAFVKLHYDIGYTHLVILEDMYYRVMKDVFQGISTKIGDLQNTKKAYEDAMGEILQNDQDKGVMKSLYKSMYNDRLKLRPEDIAESIKEKGLTQTIESLDEGDNEASF